MADHRNVDAKTHLAVSQQQSNMTERRLTAAKVHDISFKIDETVLATLHKAALNPDPASCKEAVDHALSMGISDVDLADIYIPTLARQMGDMWCEDEMSFASVTIGVSRLQAMLRLLGPNWSGDSAGQDDTPGVILIVLQEVYHTLGAIVLSGQLRRKGISVKLVLGGKPKDIAERICRTKYQSVFISSSRGETLESIRRLVDTVRASTKTPPPIVVGGTILEVETQENVTALTGADYATAIPEEALRFCGLLETTQRDTLTKFRS